MKLFPNVPPKKIDKTEPKVSEEGLLFSIESTKAPDVNVVLDSNSNLIPLENLNNDEFETEHDTGVSVEELIINESGVEKAGPGNHMEMQKMPRTVFIKSDVLANVYLHGNCSESLDMLIHVLSHAPKDMVCNISYCGAWFNIYDMMELVGAIAASEATVNITLAYCRSPLELLLAKVADNVEFAAGYVIQPIRSNQSGSVKNIEKTTRAEREYLEIIYESLIENGIVTKNEIDAMSDDNVITFIKGSDIIERLKA